MLENKSLDSFKSLFSFNVEGKTYEYFSLEKLENRGFSVSRLPYSLKVILENLLRNEDGRRVMKKDIENVSRWDPQTTSDQEIFFMPARVLMQDFTGVPAIVDLAAMREAMKSLGGDPSRINPLVPVDLVVDHSVQVDSFGVPQSFSQNTKREYERNKERYMFLKWGQKAFKQFRVVPPETGIVHQVNLEHLARVVWTQNKEGNTLAYPDTLVGTDSHTTMINGLGVVGWGVGGIEAEAAILGQPIPMLVPPVIGVKMTGRMAAGTTATDLVLTVTQRLRQKGVVGKFVEFFGPGLDALSLPDRATISNMCPEYGATVGFFPVDQLTLDYLALSGRPESLIQLVEKYCQVQGIFRTSTSPDPVFSEVVEFDLGAVEPSLAGPRLPQQRVVLSQAKKAFEESFSEAIKGSDSFSPEKGKVAVSSSISSSMTSSPAVSGVAVRVQSAGDGKWQELSLRHGSVVIAAITSCTNTSNPSVMMAAGILARNALQKGLHVEPWVKTSLAPGSKVVIDYLKSAGLLSDLEKLGFYLVGYGCTTCIGNSGPLAQPISDAISENGLVAAAVLSGNRNFEGRINPHVRAAYLASPPLVVAYALAGRVDIDLTSEPLGQDPKGQPVYLKEIWPSPEEVQETVQAHLKKVMFEKQYAGVFEGDQNWRSLPVPPGELYQWDPESTYVRLPPYFRNLKREPGSLSDIKGARVLIMAGDSVSTDHISPAGSIAHQSPAGEYLTSKGVGRQDFNSYGSRRGNHEVMMRGTFANIRFKNLLVSGTEGWWTVQYPNQQKTTIFNAAIQYQKENIPTIILAGKEYGSGSSRDWAAKGPSLLGVKAVIAESFERIHRSNLVGMGILPLQFLPGENCGSLGLTGQEIYDIVGLEKEQVQPRQKMVVRVVSGGQKKEFEVVLRVDTSVELEYVRHGGILLYVLRQLLSTLRKGDT